MNYLLIFKQICNIQYRGNAIDIFVFPLILESMICIKKTPSM